MPAKPSPDAAAADRTRAPICAQVKPMKSAQLVLIIAFPFPFPILVLAWALTFAPILIVFPHYGVTRLVTIFLLLKLLLPLNLLRVSIP